jgi:dTDP-4-amino-4,6-dideoxygalactose transaminase
MPSDIIPPAKPYFPRTDIDEAKQRLDEILTSGSLTLGKYTREFERQFAELVKVQYAIAVNSGTSALEIAIRGHDIREGDEVVIPTNTFGATCAAVIFAGGKPKITDVSHDTMTISVEAIEEALSPKTKGVIAVHIGGLICPEMDSIRKLCEERGLFLIEDAAHAHGSKINGKHAGSLASAGCFSFYPTKVMTTGEGGMITTESQELSTIAQILRDHGKESYNSNRIVRLGFNWRMPELCAVLGMLQLRRLHEFIEKRNSIAKIYDAAFDAIGLERVITPANQVNNYYKYTFLLPKNVERDKFKTMCRERGVAYGGEVYWPPLHLQPAFSDFLDEGARFDTADELTRRMVNPPIFSQMTVEQAERVVKVTREVLSQLGS